MASPQGPLAPGTARVKVAPAQRQRSSIRLAELAIACLTLAAASLLLYLRPVFDLGFYYDDWSLLSAFGDAQHSTIGALNAACRDIYPAGQAGECLYHATTYAVLGGSTAAYHVLSLAFLVATSALIYVLLRQCRLTHWPALLVSVLFVLYPGSDATRLWPSAIDVQYVLAIYLAAVLAGIEGLRRHGLASVAWHTLSLGLFALIVITDEAAVPLIAVSGAFYLRAADDRRAARGRGAFDLALGLSLVVYRLLLAPADPGSLFGTRRSVGDWLDHALTISRGAWDSWHSVFLAGPGPLIAGIVAIVIAATAIVDAERRPEILRWLAVAAGAVAFGVLAVVPYASAADIYVPDTSSLFDRLNGPAAPAYCLLFVALAAATRVAFARWLGARAATIAVAVAVIASAVSQVGVERDSQDVWAASWDAQTSAIAGLERAAPKLPRDATLMSFGHPIWERGFIPVFAAGWDLRGAVDVKTRVDPPQASPFVDAATCGPQAAEVAGLAFARYAGAPSPLWFVNTKTGEVRRIASRGACAATVKRWGRPPFWGVTVTGPA